MISQKTSLAIELINIENDGSHLIIKARINNKNARLLIDTGASRSVFDQQRILNFIHSSSLGKHDKFSTGLGTDSMPTSIALLKSFRLGDLLLKDYESVLLDLGHVNKSYEKMGHHAIDGVLGNDILLRYKAVINYQKMEMKLLKK